MQSRAEREAARPGGTIRPQRQRPQHSATGTASQTNWPAIGLGLGAVALVAFLIYAVLSAGNGPQSPEELPWNKAQLDDNPNLPGQYIPPHPGVDGELTPGISGSDDRQHYATGVSIPICTQEQLDSGNISDPLCYTSNPPTSGPHGESPARFGVLQNPAPKEALVHNMEHSGVVIWYNTSDQEVIDKLKEIVEEATDRRKLVVMSQYTGMEADTIALTAWTRLDKFPVSDYDERRINNFIDEHSRRFNPEGF